MKKLSAILMVVLLLAPWAAPQNSLTYPMAAKSFGQGVYYAPSYNFSMNVAPNTTGGTSGAYSLTVFKPYVTLPDGRQVLVFQVGNPVTVGQGAAQETATITAVSSGCTQFNAGVGSQACNFTATWSNAHGAGDLVQSGSFGLQEAINDAFSHGGGLVAIDQIWANQPLVTGNTTSTSAASAIITAALVYPSVSIVDYRTGIPRYWVPTPTGAAVTAPATLTGQSACDSTHQFCSDSTVAGSASYAGGTLFGCATYVDVMGNESPCSATNSFTDVSAKAIDMKTPAASTATSVVGWIPYLSLDGGTYAQAYKITPTAAICTLSTISPIPACAITNSTYGTTGSTFGKNALFNGGAQITAIAVNTAQHFPALGATAMTAASMTPITNSSVTYSYAPGNRVGACQISSANVVNYGVSGSSATTVPNAIATWTIPANCFNFIGAEFRVSGKFTFTDGGDTSTKVLVAWDASGTNTTTVPTTLCSMVDTATGTAAAYNGTYYCSVKIATTGATGTALVDGYANLKLSAGATTLVRDTTDIAVAPSASINLTSDARIVAYFIGTGATNNPGAQGLAAKLEILN